jgi:hypothetical protein
MIPFRLDKIYGTAIRYRYVDVKYTGSHLPILKILTKKIMVSYH